MLNIMVKKDFAYAIELPYWQAPNDDIVIKSQGDSLSAFFKIWSSPAKYSVYTGIFKFSYVWAMRFERNKDLYYYINREEDNYRACYWIVSDSSWLEKLKKERYFFFFLVGKNMTWKNIFTISSKVINFLLK